MGCGRGPRPRAASFRSACAAALAAGADDSSRLAVRGEHCREWKGRVSATDQGGEPAAAEAARIRVAVGRAGRRRPGSCFCWSEMSNLGLGHWEVQEGPGPSGKNWARSTGASAPFATRSGEPGGLWHHSAPFAMGPGPGCCVHARGRGLDTAAGSRRAAAKTAQRGRGGGTPVRDEGHCQLGGPAQGHSAWARGWPVAGPLGGPRPPESVATEGTGRARPPGAARWSAHWAVESSGI